MGLHEAVDAGEVVDPRGVFDVGALGILVALARIAGETAPLLFTAFGNPFMEWRLNEPVASLPLLIYQYAISPYDDWHRQAWAASLVLIGLVLAVSVLARAVFKNPYRNR